MVTCCIKQVTLFYYCARFCETCSSALIGARFFGQAKNWRTSQSNVVTCPADKWNFFLISIPAIYSNLYKFPTLI